MSLYINKNFKNNYIHILLFIIILISYFLGFVLNEDSSGGGKIDFEHEWTSFLEFKKFGISALTSDLYESSRTPLFLLINKYNFFAYDQYSFRQSNFIFNFFIIISFIICLIFQKKLTLSQLIIVSSFIMLSPYFRTSAYWGMEMNYGIISMLASIYFLNSALYKNINNKFNLYFYLTLLTFFSSLCLYFDQKLLIIPLIALFEILRAKIDLRYKIFSLINYCIFAIPFLYLIYIWQGIAPTATQIANPDQGTHLSGINLHFFNIGYASAIMAFYLIPIIFLKEESIINIFKKFFSERKNLYKVSLFLIYLIYIIFFADFDDFTKKFDPNVRWGLGILHKVSLFLFGTSFYGEVFTYFSFFISWIIILVAIEKKIINYIVIFYFYFLSVLLLPLMQEYFDPYILLFSLLLLDFKFEFKFEKVLSVFLYLSIFLTGANTYYLIRLS